MIDLTQYWPWGTVMTKLFINADSGAIAIGQQTRPIAHPAGLQAITLTDTDGTLAMLDRWHLALDPARGVIEYQDDAANGNRYVYIQPLRWGGQANIGDRFDGQLQLDPEQSIGIPPDDRAYGWSSVVVAAITDIETPAGKFSDVVRLDWSQSWCADAGCTTTNDNVGSYYFAPGVGIVQMDWTYPERRSALLAAIVRNRVPGA